MWESSQIRVYKALYDPESKRLSLSFVYEESSPLKIWWMDSPMGGHVLEKSLSTGSYQKVYHRPEWPDLYAVWFMIDGVTVLEIPVSEILSPEEPPPDKPKSKLPLILGGLALAVVAIAVIRKRKI